MSSWGKCFRSIAEMQKLTSIPIKEIFGKKGLTKDGIIHLPKHYWNELALCHEMAHFGYENEKLIHGIEFCKREIELVRLIVGAELANELKAQLIKVGFRFT